ncbi:hypothetical protein JCM10213_005109 [Rhodosporidiobolus nylandii]
MTTIAELPFEVLQLVVDELDGAHWDPQARRAEGRNLALVCKAWQPLGASLIYRELSLRGVEQNAELWRMLEQPEVQLLITDLTYTDSRSTPSPRRLALLEQLLPSCAALARLHLYSTPSTINRIFGERGLLLPTTLTSLTLRSIPFLDSLDIGPIMSTLAHFRSLRHLDLLVSMPFAISATALERPRSLRLPLRTLVLAFPPSNLHSRHVEYLVLGRLTSLLDPAQLVSLDLRLAAAESFLFTFLSILPSLRKLHLHLQHDTIEAHLAELLATLPSLTSLRDLLLRQRVLPVPRSTAASPAALAGFLASLPPSVEAFSTALFFPGGASVGPVQDFLQARAAGDAALRRFTCEVSDVGGGGGRSCELQRLRLEDGRFCWVETDASDG